MSDSRAFRHVLDIDALNSFRTIGVYVFLSTSVIDELPYMKEDRRNKLKKEYRRLIFKRNFTKTIKFIKSKKYKCLIKADNVRT